MSKVSPEPESKRRKTKHLLMNLTRKEEELLEEYKKTHKFQDSKYYKIFSYMFLIVSFISVMIAVFYNKIGKIVMYSYIGYTIGSFLTFYYFYNNNAFKNIIIPDNINT